MKICEQFLTLQGEGKYLGYPSYFIRTTGCNLRCAWKNRDGSITKCDTPYTSWRPEKGWDFDMADTLNLLAQKKARHVVITGGEPMMQKDITDVANCFIEKGYLVTIETNGTIYNEKLHPSTFISCSPKLKSSYPQEDSQALRLHCKNNSNLEDSLDKIIQHFEDYQIKFVVNDQKDWGEVLHWQKKLQIPRDKVWIMPQGISKEQLQSKAIWLFQMCMEEGFSFTPRMHVDIFGNKRKI
jgi:7-carboxy-7-deazaguanine synthase